MSLDVALNFVPTFALVFFRLAGMMAFAPMLGSGRVPRRVRVLLALVMSLPMVPLAQGRFTIPQTTWGLALGIGSELIFGIAMGMSVSMVFIAAQWAGEIMGQQMGLNISEVLDPQFGQQGSLVGDLYFMLTIVVFLSPPVNGYRALIEGVAGSFKSLPLLSVGMDRPMFDSLTGLFEASTVLAIRLAAPMLMTMLIVDVALGCISRAVPQINIMTAGLTVRSLVGAAVLLLGLLLTQRVITEALHRSVDAAHLRWTTPVPGQ
ncbi:MAG: flagellar biosynthetic protein FliR [Tepidisphaeraceae bacterium]